METTMEFKTTMEFAPGTVSGRLANNQAARPNLLFLNISNPSDTRHPGVLRLVRSHVTVQQHDRHRCKPFHEGELKGADSKEEPLSISTASIASHGQGRLAEGSPVRKLSREPNQDPTSFTFLAVDPTDEHTTTLRKQVHSHVARRQHQRRRAAHRRAHESLKATSRQPKKASKSLLPMLITPAGDPSDLLDVNIRELGLSMLEVLDHYQFIIKEQSPAFEGQNPQYNGWGERVLYPLMTSHQITLGGAAILVSSHMRFLRGESHITPELLRLRATILRHIQAAVDDRSHQLDDVTLLAVALMASYEAIYGTELNYRVHMQGLVAMIRMRGGLDKLGQDGYVAHVLLWFDSNASTIIGTKPYCDKLEGWQSVRFPEAKEGVFDMGVVGSSDSSDTESLTLDERTYAACGE